MKQVIDVNELAISGLENMHYFVKNNRFKKITVDSSTYIIKQNSNIDFLYWSDIAQFTLQRTAKNGKSLNLGVYCATNCLFGEIECITNDKAQFDVVALEPTELIVIPKNAFLNILKKDARVAVWHSQNIANYYQRTMNISIDRTLYPLKRTIAEDLRLRHFNQLYADNHTNVHKEAQRFGCSERAYNRIIKELIEQKIIIKKEKKIKPYEINKLIDFINSYDNN